MNRSSISSLFWGAVLILAGGAWLMSNLFDISIDFEVIWPIFLLVPGLILWASYLFGNEEGVETLIPANILLFLSITFFFNTFASTVLDYERAWLLTVSMYSTGPVAIAFWITWLASGRKAGYLIPAVILTIISVCIALFTVPLALFDSRIFADLTNLGLPVMLIVIGLLIIFGPFWTKLFDSSTNKKESEAERKEKENIEEAEIVEAKEVSEATDRGQHNNKELNKNDNQEPKENNIVEDTVEEDLSKLNKAEKLED